MNSPTTESDASLKSLWFFRRKKTVHIGVMIVMTAKLMETEWECKTKVRSCSKNKNQKYAMHNNKIER